VLSGCGGAYKISVERPTKAKADMAEFQRVLLAGFVTEGRSPEIDVNLETVRALGAALRSQTALGVIESAGSRPATENAAPHTDEDCETRTSRPVFANTVFWKRLGEEHLAPLIITGTVRYSAQYRRGFAFDAAFLLIDGRTGSALHSACFREQLHYGRKQRGSALSAYFELMDRITPALLNTFSDQRIRVTRTLLK
jgi:hypothetical protein